MQGVLHCSVWTPGSAISRAASGRVEMVGQTAGLEPLASAPRVTAQSCQRTANPQSPVRRGRAVVQRLCRHHFGIYEQVQRHWSDQRQTSGKSRRWTNHHLSAEPVAFTCEFQLHLCRCCCRTRRSSGGVGRVSLMEGKVPCRRTAGRLGSASAQLMPVCVCRFLCGQPSFGGILSVCTLRRHRPFVLGTGWCCWSCRR